jgi:hypothetical protein
MVAGMVLLGLKVENEKEATDQSFFSRISSSFSAMRKSVIDHVSPSCSITHIPEYVFVVFHTQPSIYII